MADPDTPDAAPDLPSGAEHAAVVARARRSCTHPRELAVVLESEGLNDRLARERHGAPDVFALAEAAMAAEPDEGAEPPGASPRRRVGAVLRSYLRGLLYAVPAVVALALLPAGDPVESALLLGGLALSWAWGYGMTYVAWAYLGNLDRPAAHRFLRRSMVAGTLLAALVAVAAVYAALAWTVTMQVTLWTLLLLVGQTAYLLAASALLMAGHELALLVALAPAVAAAGLALHDHTLHLAVGTVTFAPRDADVPPAAALALAASVVLTVLFALAATWRAAPPAQRLHRATWRRALLHAAYGLTVALLVLFPAVNELLNENFESLPLSVTLAALPLVLGMGVAEAQLHAHRAKVRRLLASTASPREFAHGVRRSLARTHLWFVAVLALMTAALGTGTAVLGIADPRFLLLGVDYLLLGSALFAAMVLNLMGRITTVLCAMVAAVAVLLAAGLQADHTVGDTTALLLLGVVAALLAAVQALLVHRSVAWTVSHW